MIEVPGSPAQHELDNRFLVASTSLTFRACYCSVFDQCWMSTLSGLRPTPIKTCPMDVRSFNAGTM